MPCGNHVVSDDTEILQIRRTRDLRIGSHTDEKLKTCLTAFQYSSFYSTGITGDGDDHFIGMTGTDIRVIYCVIDTAADFTALSAITRPIAAGEPAMKPNASPRGVPKALWIAGPALAEKANSGGRIR